MLLRKISDLYGRVRFPALPAMFILTAVSNASLNAAASPGSDAAAASGLPLVNMASPNIQQCITTNYDQVSFALSHDPKAPGIAVTVHSGKEDYPGINIKPEGAVWNLSAYGSIEARVVNTGAKALTIGLRVDNEGDWREEHNNTECVTLAPGAPGTVTVRFGSSYGQPGYPLDRSAVVNLVLFVVKSEGDQSFCIGEIRAVASPKLSFSAASERIKPVDGLLLGPSVTIDAAKQLEVKGGAQVSMAGSALKISFAQGRAGQFVSLKPFAGRWDLRDAVEVRLTLKNTGPTPVRPSFQVMSDSGSTGAHQIPSPLTPGAEAEISIPFAARVPWVGINDSTKAGWDGQPGTGTKFASDKVMAVIVLAEDAQSLTVESIKAGAPLAGMPDWLGKRPPVDGNWAKTFDEEFDGDSVDKSKWNVYAENYWDKPSHFSKDNVIIAGGVARLHYEKKMGYQNDDPSRKQTAHTTGYLDTLGKFTQRYGYFEARMKLTKAPGLWPAFWLMPDRGAASEPPEGMRCTTEHGGMEFDIMEHLDRWGPYRYNIAMHWDGYGKGHRQTGSDTIYISPDSEGFITAGLLWTPGQAIYYANGKEVLRWESTRISNVPSDIMFTNVTGGWDNNAIDDSKLPDDFIVDYVRVWQRKDLASNTGNTPIPSSPAPNNQLNQ